MPIATPEIYAQMLDRAKEHGFAYQIGRASCRERV